MKLLMIKNKQWQDVAINIEHIITFSPCKSKGTNIQMAGILDIHTPMSFGVFTAALYNVRDLGLSVFDSMMLQKEHDFNIEQIKKEVSDGNDY